MINPAASFHKMQKLVDKCENKMREIGITDVAFSEYIFQIIEGDGNVVEQQEIISEFLIEATDSKEDIGVWVEQFINDYQLLQLEIKKEKEAKKLELPEISTLSFEQSKTRQKPTLSVQEKKEREHLLAKYGYEIDEILETENGETELVKDTQKKEPKITLAGNNNRELVREKEALKRLAQKEQALETKKNNKLALEKQKLEKEARKTKTQKREKVRF